jgi:uncharacterized protein
VDDFRAPPWLPGGNLQTIWAALASRRHLAHANGAPQFTRERWTTPDGDFIDVDHLRPPPGAPAISPTTKRHLVLFHGLEGSSQSQYAQAFASVAQQRGWAFSVPHFRGCSGELNLAPRAYHSGDFEEIGWILQRLRPGRRKPATARQPRPARWRRCVRPSTWPPPGTPSTGASTGWSTRACSCAP